MNMANPGLYLLLFLSLQNLTFAADHAAVDSNLRATNFIRAACRATLYPALCVQCLSTYAKTIQQSERQLARAALAVSLARARSSAVFVSKFYGIRSIKPREYQAVKDCIDNMGDSVDQLSQSVQELGRMNRVTGQDFMWHMSNVQTWVSAALTDQNTCLDGFSEPALEGNLKVSIRRRVTQVARVTSNALALVNRFAQRHKAIETTSAAP